jgi:hypothetical protein
LGDLAPDVAVDPNHLDGRKSGRPPVLVAGSFDVYPELALLQAGGNVGVGLWIHVRVHADRHPGHLAQAPGHFVDVLDLFLALHIEHQNALFEGAGNLLVRLSHPGEHDSLGGNARPQCAVKLPARNDVETATHLGEKAQNGDVRIGLHGEENEARNPAEGLVENAKMAYKGLMAVDVKRRSHLLGEPAERNPLGEKFPVLVRKMVHP